MGKGIYIRTEETRNKLSEFHRGRLKPWLKGKSSWNKGKHLSIETRRKISLAKIGKHLSEETKRKLRERIISEDTRKKISLLMKGKPKSEEHKRRLRELRKGTHHSEETKQKIWNTRLRGDKHWNWKGGISSINESLRKSSMFKVWRELVFLRDNFTCQNPNCEYCHNLIGVMLHPHHIKPFAIYPELRFNVNNGITYCKEFHINSKLLHKNIWNITIKNSREKNEFVWK